MTIDDDVVRPSPQRSGPTARVGAGPLSAFSLLLVLFGCEERPETVSPTAAAPPGERADPESTPAEGAPGKAGGSADEAPETDPEAAEETEDHGAVPEDPAPSEEDDDHRGQGMAHSFADVARFARMFDAPDRDEWQKPAQVLRLLAVEAGMTVVDLGAGTGYFLPHLAKAVGDDGTVLALDVEPNMVAHMKDRMEQVGFDDVVTAREVAPDDPELDPGSVDRILVVDTWHHLGDREAYAARLRRALRPGGQLLVVDFTEDAPRGPPKVHRLTAPAVAAELEAAGFPEVQVVEESLPDQWVVRAAVPG